MNLRKLSTAVMFGCISAIGLTGCEGVESQADRADRRIDDAVTQAVEQLRVGDAAGAAQTLQPVRQQTDASAAGRVRGHAMLAEADLAQALQLLKDVDAAHVQATTLAWQIDQLADRMHAAATSAQAYQAMDPSETRQQVTQSAKAIQGGADSPVWYPDEDGDGDIPTLSQLDQTISRLQGEITRKRQQIEQLTAQRNQLNKEAQDTFARANELTGQEAVDEFRKGTQIRHNVATIAIQIDQINYQLGPLLSDLSVAEAQRKVLQAAVEKRQQQSEAIAKNWDDISAQADQQRTLARQIAGNGQAPEGVPTINELAAQLSTVIDQAWQKRQQAHSLLQSAIEHSSTAATSAQQLEKTLSERIRTQEASKPAFEGLKKIHNAQIYRLAELNARHHLATSWAGHAAMLRLQQQARDKVQTVSQIVPQLTMPASLAAADLDQRVQQTRQAMTTAFEEAVELAGTIAEAPGADADQRNAASITRALTLYAWGMALRDAGDTQAADARIAQANELLPKGDDVALPPLPAGLSRRTGTQQ